MPVRLYNTLTQKVEDFVPLTPGKVSLYVCGITTYDLPHAGHARTYTTFDVLVRFLRARGFEVKHCRNVTDVDDKIVNRAKEKGQEPLALSKHFSDLADAQLKALGCLVPDVNPRVSTSMKDIVSFIEKLIAKVPPMSPIRRSARTSTIRSRASRSTASSRVATSKSCARARVNGSPRTRTT
jgi:cysteinyl-tRNA synthetase